MNSVKSNSPSLKYQRLERYRDYKIRHCDKYSIHLFCKIKENQNIIFLFNYLFRKFLVFLIHFYLIKRGLFGFFLWYKWGKEMF